MEKGLASLGPVMQMAFVPADFDAALRFWTQTMKVGPFFALEHVKFEDTRYFGAPTQPDISVYLSYWGDMQIELVRQHNDAPSIYRTWLDAGKDGLHHTCVLVDDMAAARVIATACGAKPALEARIPGGGEAMYLETGGGSGTLLEVLKPAPGMREAFAMFKAASQKWDGANPVRRLG